MTSRNGLSFSEADEDGLVYINLFLSGMSSNLANISFEINKTHNVTVLLFNTEAHEIKLMSKYSFSSGSSFKLLKLKNEKLKQTF